MQSPPYDSCLDSYLLLVCESSPVLPKFGRVERRMADAPAPAMTDFQKRVP
jgi:hypothetical protein